MHSTTKLRSHRLLRMLTAISFAIASRSLVAQNAPVVFHVRLGQASATPVAGRLLVLARLLAASDKRPVTRVDMDQIDTRAVAIAAQEVSRLAPNASVDIDADVTAYPSSFSQLRPGRYAVQAVLDRDHS